MLCFFVLYLQNCRGAANGDCRSNSVSRFSINRSRPPVLYRARPLSCNDTTTLLGQHGCLRTGGCHTSPLSIGLCQFLPHQVNTSGRSKVLAWIIRDNEDRLTTFQLGVDHRYVAFQSQLGITEARKGQAFTAASQRTETTALVR